MGIRPRSLIIFAVATLAGWPLATSAQRTLAIGAGRAIQLLGKGGLGARGAAIRNGAGGSGLAAGRGIELLREGWLGTRHSRIWRRRSDCSSHVDR